MRARPSRRDLLRACGALYAASALAGCSSDSQAATTVEMTDDLTFEPAELTVSVGDTVTWTNVGTLDHTVTAYGDGIPDGAAYFASGGFDAEQAARDAYPDQGAVGEDETYDHTFDTAGTFRYFCIPHESAGMEGSIVVES